MSLFILQWIIDVKVYTKFSINFQLFYTRILEKKEGKQEKNFLTENSQWTLTFASLCVLFWKVKDTTVDC